MIIILFTFRFCLRYVVRGLETAGSLAYKLSLLRILKACVLTEAHLLEVQLNLMYCTLFTFFNCSLSLSQYFLSRVFLNCVSCSYIGSWPNKKALECYRK